MLLAIGSGKLCYNTDNCEAGEVRVVYASQLRSGMAIHHEGVVYKVMLANYHPGQGKMGGVAHVRLKNLATGALWEQNFRADLKLEELPIEKQSMEFLYSDANYCHFMNPETYDQVEISSSLIGPQTQFLLPEMRLTIEFVEGQPVSVDFPASVEIRVTETAPPVHQQQDSTLKSAKLENGVEVMVPQFIKSGDIIRFDTQSFKYIERAKGAGK
jgi:elongation factor P